MAYLHDLADTWNDSGTTFTALKMNVTDTASNAASKLLDLQVGGSSRALVTKAGYHQAGRYLDVTGVYGWQPSSSGSSYLDVSASLIVRNGSSAYAELARITTSGISVGTGNDCIIARDAANTLALRNTIAAQTLNVYNTYTDASNYERFATKWSSNEILLGVEAAGTGAARNLWFTINGTKRMCLDTNGHFGINAGRSLYFGGNTVGNAGISITQSSNSLAIAGATLGVSVAGYSVTGSGAESLLGLAGTWNTSGTPTAIKLNVTDTASNSASKLLDLQVGGSSKVSFTKAGSLTTAPAASHTFGAGFYISDSSIKLRSISSLGWSSTSIGGTEDLYVYRDGPNTLGLRNSTNAQAFNVYNTYTDASNYERGCIKWVSNVLKISAEAAGTGSARSIEFITNGITRLTIASGGDVTANSIGASSGNSLILRGASTGAAWRVTTGGNLDTQSDNTFDIGAASSNRPRNLFLGSYTQMSEMTAPSAPAANSVRIYAEDNGSGKTRLMALFATGAAQQIAIEP